MRSTIGFATVSLRWPLGWAILAAASFVPSTSAATPLSIEETIRAAWKNNPGIASSQEAVAAARADADSARDGRLPSVVLSAKALATQEPVAAFGLKLDEGRIGATDFDPARLNSPGVTGGVGFGAALIQPLYMGGRLTAGRRAARAEAEAAGKAHERRKQELALQVVQAYFGVEVAAIGVRYADDVLQHARETESFTQARNQQGLALDADVARATAFRAQAEADQASAVERLASARSMLALLAGSEVGEGDLPSPLAADQASQPSPRSELAARADLESARLHTQAAQSMLQASRGNLLPEVMAQASVETMRSALDQGATWFTAGVFARWKLSMADLRGTQAAKHRARAAEEAQQWQQQKAGHEVDEAQRALATSRTRLSSAREAVAASESARTLRIERHRQGLVPLTDVLDAEAALAGARTLLLRSQFEVRVATAQLQLALGNPIEGVN